MLAFFDNEEIGSESMQGANSSLMSSSLKRIWECLTNNNTYDSYMASIRRSFMLSVDGAHACHPNYTEKHEPTHKPVVNKGFVIKTNHNMAYATDSIGSVIMRKLANE